jgi:hypothetical protein
MRRGKDYLPSDGKQNDVNMWQGKFKCDVDGGVTIDVVPWAVKDDVHSW